MPKKSPKVKVDVFYPLGKKEPRKVKTDKNKLLMEKDWTPTFQPSDFFEERRGFLRMKRRFLMIGYLMTKTISWDETQPKEKGGDGKVKVDDFQLFWTPKEQRELIKKEVAKAKSTMRPFSTSMFIVMIGFSIVSLIILFAIAMRLGVFS